MIPGDTYASPAEARAVWESMAKPSYRRVALALAQAGKKLSHTTVRRWHRHGWTRQRDPANAPEPRAELDAAVPVLTGDAMRRLDSLAADAADKDLTDEERIAGSLRELAACSVAVLRAVRRADHALIVAHPDKVGILLEKIAAAMKAATECLARLDTMRAGVATDVTPPQGRDDAAPHPLAGTLDAIKQARQG